MLDGQLDAFAELREDPTDDELPEAFRLVVICPPCDTATEAAPDELPDTCPVCGSPVITGEIGSRAPDRARSV
ncbi:hypothetical protein Ae406Ps2_6440c [Pseudonocardia sp. Ae406_Ps2]|uniref:hypothetical protein n=1 Tax=unclassified Pseudonocardia TaxID=2619320 RepID=UPI0009656B93|nr:hypothetical protein [Pseudonocardia sp. Ae406_Ps2]OLL89512.1 hypothetical protein Ae406Ps2_6440c [Pseudonocardia sp. Ae406_Ps2]